jgi:serine/threonine-protein kinase
MADQPDDGRVGKRFGRYEIRALLAQTGVGQLYQALDTANNRAGALTLLSPSVDRQRFLTELPIVARTADPHLIPVHDWGEIDGVCFVASPLTPGETLRSLLSTYGPMTPQRAVAIVEQVAAALDAARAHRLVHRDVRPENILVTDDDAAFLLGFGVADPELSAPRPTAGSYAYTAPERFDNAAPSTRSDVYSLACVLTELLTGDRPFPAATTVGQVIKAHLTAAPPKPSLVRPQAISPRFDAVIARGMAKNPQHRYATAGDLAHAAREALSAQAVADQPTMVGRASDLAAVAAKRRPPQRISQQVAEPDSYPDSQPDYYSESYPDEFAEPAWQRSRLLTLALAVVVVLVLTAAAIVVWRLAATHGQPPAPTKPAPTAYRATILPFTGLRDPSGLAVDESNSLYVTDGSRVVLLTAGATKQILLPVPQLNYTHGVAVDASGNIYVSDYGNDQVVKLVAS